MKVKNSEILDIYRCINEVIGCKEAKLEIPESGKLMYAIIKSQNLLKSVVNDLAKREHVLREAVKEAGQDKDGVMDQFGKDMQAMFDEEQEISVHKISMDHFEVLQKYLTGPDTVALLNYLTIDIKQA